MNEIEPLKTVQIVAGAEVSVAADRFPKGFQSNPRDQVFRIESIQEDDGR